MKLLDYSGLQRFLNKIKTLLDSKSNTGHTHVTSEVTDLLNSQHTWSAQQSYSADLNLNYASTDVDDIIDTVAGSYTAEDFLAQNNVWTGDNTFSKEVTLTKVNAPSLKYQNSRAELGETNLSGDTYTQISFEDKNGDNFGYLRQTYYVDGDNRISIYVRNKFTSGAPSTSGTADYAYFGLRLNADKSKEGVLRGTFRPYDNNAYDLGSSSYQWKSVYAKNYYYNGTAFGDIVTHNASEFSVPGHTHSASDITSGLATVATSGSYNDLSNKPTIPTVNNATLTIQKNGTTVKTFTANASSNVTANITVPTKTSELTNDSHSTITMGTDSTSTASPAHGDTFTCIDSVTKDTNGHVTAVNTKTVTLPADNNTDTKMTQNVSTTNATYPILLCATADATANQGAKTGIFAKSVKVNPSTNVISASGFSGPLTGDVTGNCSGSSGSCTGNAATATQFSANKSVTLTGDVTGTASSKAGWSVATTLANSGVTAGTYGPSADVTGNNNATISVPEITVDAKGRVTSVTNRTLTCKNNTYSVYNKTLTIQKNGTNVATFTSNSNTDVTANITVPTKVSELTNDSGFLTSHQSLSNYVTLDGAQTISGVKTLVDYWHLQAKNLKAGEGETYGRTGYSLVYTDKNDATMGDVTLYKNSGAARTYLRLRGGDYYTNGAPAAAGTIVQSELRIGTLANSTRMIECVADAVYSTVNNATDLGTFNNQWANIYGTNLHSRNTEYTKGTVPSANKFHSLRFVDSAGNESSRILRWVNSDGYNGFSFQCWNERVSTDSSCTMALGYTPQNVSYCAFSNLNRVIPETTNSTDLGISTLQWKSVYAQSYYYNGTAWGLDKGNTWTEGNVFTKSITFKNTDITNYKANPSSDTERWIQFWSNEWKYWGGVGHVYLTTGVSEIRIAMTNWRTNGSQGYWHLDFGTDKAFSRVYFRPSGDALCCLGDNDHKWAYCHAVNFYENGTALSSKYMEKLTTGAIPIGMVLMCRFDFDAIATGSSGSKKVASGATVSGNYLRMGVIKEKLFSNSYFADIDTNSDLTVGGTLIYKGRTINESEFSGITNRNIIGPFIRIS